MLSMARCAFGTSSRVASPTRATAALEKLKKRTD